MVRTRLYGLHSRRWGGNRYVYPVVSRRSGGLSVGVNLNPDGVCNFDCVYCCVDRSKPVAPDRRGVDLGVLREELAVMLEVAASGEVWAAGEFAQTPLELRVLRDVAFSGDGEPTSCAVFPEACREVASALAAAGLGGTKIVLITNATLLHRPPVVEALKFLDSQSGEVWGKLDAGTDTYYRTIDRSAVPLARVLDNLLVCGREREIVIQSMFLRLHGNPPPGEELDAYVGRLCGLVDGGARVKAVQVYTVARKTAEAYVTPLSDDEVDAIVARVRAVGLKAEGYYGVG